MGREVKFSHNFIDLGPSHVAPVGNEEGARTATTSTLLSLPPPSPLLEDAARQSLASVAIGGVFRLLA